MESQVDAMTVRKSFGTLMNKVHYQNQVMVVNRAKKPMVAIIPIELLAEIKRFEDRLDSKIQNSAKRNNLSYKEAMRLANKAREYARK